MWRDATWTWRTAWPAQRHACRKFPRVAATLLSVAVGLPFWSTFSWADDHSLAIAKGYIRPLAPSFELPFPEGIRYRDRVPDTLDLVEMATLAINGLTGPYDPAAGYELYFTVCLQRNPPVMQHDFSDDNQMKFMAPLTLMRLITGSRLAQDLERGMIGARLRCVTEDGLYHRPLSGRPWLEENMWEEVKPKKSNQPLPPYEGGRMSARLLEGLIVYARVSSAPLFKTLADGMVRNGAGGGLENYVKTTNDWGVPAGTQENTLPKVSWLATPGRRRPSTNTTGGLATNSSRPQWERW